MHEILRGQCFGSFIRQPGKAFCTPRKDEGNCVLESWQRDLCALLSRLVWHGHTPLSSRKMLSATAEEPVFVFGWMCRFPSIPYLWHTQSQSCWIHMDSHKLWQWTEGALPCSCLRQAGCSAKHFKINYSQIRVYIQASEWKVLKTWIFFFLNGKTQLYPSAQGMMCASVQHGESWWQEHRWWSS